jgi:predicted nucleic acid-binding protein
VVPVQALLDLERVLIDKISASPADVRQFRDTIAELAAELAPTPEEVAAVSGDQEDDRIIAAALAAMADVLVSGDSKHVLPLGAIGGMRILKPQTMLAELSRRDA